MPKYKIYWDAGYGKSYNIVEARDKVEADSLAYDSWNDEAQSNAEYGVVGEVGVDDMEDGE